LSCWKKAIEVDPQQVDLKLQLSIRLNYLGEVYWILGQSQSTKDCFERALNIRQALVDAEPQRVDLKHRLAMSFSELGVWTRGIGQGEKSRHYFEKALKLRKTLVKRGATT
jgi:tetratricopeptide (TPR) repeat protein